MVFGMGSKPMTAEAEDPRGTKKYHFSFGTMTRGELQSKIEGLLTDYKHAPLDGAEAVLSLFATVPDAKILRESPTIQGVLQGSNTQQGPIMYFMKKAAEAQVATGVADPAATGRFASIKYRYEKVLADIELGRMQMEDPTGSKQYEFSFGKMTASGLQQRIEDTLRQYNDAGQPMEGAQALMDMMTTVPDARVLRDSPTVRNRMLGGINQKGPVDYFLEQAEAKLAEKGDEGKADGIRLEKLQRRYATVREDAIGRESTYVQAPAARR